MRVSLIYAVWLLLAACLCSAPCAAAEEEVIRRGAPDPTEDEEEPAELTFLRTPDLRLLYFHPSETYLARYSAQAFENSMIGQRAIFGWEPDGEVTVVLKDFGDYGNAAASANPRNRLLLDIAPLSLTFETFTASERLYTLMNHELVHVATMDQAARQDMRWRTFFAGKVFAVPEHPETILYEYLTTPRTAVPRWYLEGIAVFMETWMAGGLGRAQGAYDEMVFRAMVRDDAHFYDPLGLAAAGTKVDFQVGVNAYLYGTRFMSYLAWEYGPESLVEWVARNDESERYYARQFRQVYGKSMEDAWQDWIAFERDFQRANLEAVRQFPLTQAQPLTPRALGSVSRGFVDPAGETLYLAVRYPGVVAHIAAISLRDGSIDKLVDIKGPQLYRVTSLAYDPDGELLYYTADNNAFRDLMALDLATGKARMLLEDARIGELVFNRSDRSLWGVRHLNGIATVVRMPYPYEEWNQIHSFDYGQVPYDLDISPDGRLLSMSIGEINGDQHLRILEIESLMAGDLTPVGEFNFGLAVPESFVFSPDGQYLYGSSYYTGVSNIFRYALASGEIEGMSNAETGFFRPIPLESGDTIVFEFSGQGFVPSLIETRPLEDVSAITFLGQQLAEKYPVLATWQVGSPADIDIESKIIGEGGYYSRKNMNLESTHPIVEGYQDSVSFGYRVNISDYIGFDKLGLTASYSPDSDLDNDEKLHLYAKYQHREWTTELKYNYANFYDLFGPTDVGLKGYSAELTYDRPLIYDLPRELDLMITGGYWGNLDKVPYAQNVGSEFDELLAVRARLDYSNVRKSLGAVDDEKGHKWMLGTGANYAMEDEVVPYLFGGLDFGFALPLHHSSIWLRNSAGFAVGDKDNSFANYYFGSFLNNYVDYQEVKRYREPFSFPGYGYNDLNGRTFGKAILEWNLPPVRFRRVGTPGFFLSWARPAVFTSALVTNPEDESDRFYNAGFQLDFQFHVLSRKDMTFSVGYAWGFEGGSVSKTEFMASLKIL